MNHRWNNPILSWWPSPVSTTLGLPAAPAQPIDEAWPAPWPTPIAQTSWMPPTPTSPHLPQGGLFSSFDAGTTGGLFGRLAPHADNLNPARDWGVVPAPPSTGVSLMSVGGNYHSPVLHPTDWDAFPSRATTAMPPAMPEPPDRPSWDAPAGNDDKGTRTNNGGSAGGQNDRLILSDVAPDNEWISNGNMRATDTITLREPSMRSCRSRLRLGEYLTKALQDLFRGIIGIKTTRSTARIATQSKLMD